MSTRRPIIAVWAGLCLVGIAATAALNAEPYTDKRDSPAQEPTPTGPYAVDCREIADHIEQARAEAKREQQEALNPSATPAYQSTVRDVAVTEECADELEDRGAH
ncbi:hypothetical protein OG508_37295 [Streptomyces sp. NBC_01108]|uniref:hypothetical protein n=1 Tax=Streptomyces sp. NBC_01108 TaxID=2903751 RepID=UPI003873183B|nr:hypothetical protein OG508_37295 [Streptomyces sp. NBC_01108]